MNTYYGTELDATKVGTPGSIVIIGVSYAYRIIET
jgi:hypothetical protein